MARRDRPGGQGHDALRRHGGRLPLVGQHPQDPGQGCFQGDVYHTSQWPHDPVDFAGKRVGLIGTGSTGIQAVPVIAEQAGHLTVFQRTAQFTLPAQNHPLDAEYVADVEGQLPRHPPAAKEQPDGQPGHARRVRRPRSGGGGSHLSLRVGLGRGRRQVPRHLQGHHAQRGGQRDGGRLRAEQDRRHREGPRDGPEADADDLSDRDQADPGRQWLLRGL